MQLGEGNPFGRLPVDQTTEVTVNKDTQIVGGTTKFSLNPGAVGRHYLIAEFRSGFLSILRNFVDLKKDEAEHTDLKKSRIKTDEEDVLAVK